MSSINLRVNTHLCKLRGFVFVYMFVNVRTCTTVVCVCMCVHVRVSAGNCALVLVCVCMCEYVRECAGLCGRTMRVYVNVCICVHVCAFRFVRVCLHARIQMRVSVVCPLVDVSVVVAPRYFGRRGYFPFLCADLLLARADASVGPSHGVLGRWARDRRPLRHQPIHGEKELCVPSRDHATMISAQFAYFNIPRYCRTTGHNRTLEPPPAPHPPSLTPPPRMKRVPSSPPPAHTPRFRWPLR